MFRHIRIEAFRFTVLTYIILSLGYMGWPAICYCEDGHIEMVQAIFGCFDDKQAVPDRIDDSLCSLVGGEIGIESCDSCRDAVISIHVYWNQTLSAKSIVQMEKASYPVFSPFMVMISGPNPEKIVSISSDRIDRLNSALQSVHLLI
jgi:hypothetical protein